MKNNDKQLNEWVRKANSFLSYTIVWDSSATKGAYTVTYASRSWGPLFIDDLPQLASDLGIFNKMYPSTDAVPEIKEAQPEARIYPYIKYSLKQRSWFIVIGRCPIAISNEDAGQFLNAGLEFKP